MYVKYDMKCRVIISVLAAIGVLLMVSLGSSAAKEKKPNILLITVDSLRPDHLGCYGYKKDISPNIDRLAGEGVLFTQAIAQATWTWPSLHSIITGTYLSTHGIDRWNVISESLATIPQELKKKEYISGFITPHQYLGNLGNRGFRRGFDIFEIIPRDAAGITDFALSWIKDNKDKNFFLWVHYMDTHRNSLHLPDLELALQERERYLNRYDEGVKSIDETINVFLGKLESMGILKRTVIIITADHGEKIDEHGEFFSHTGTVWDCVIRVPLIIYYPDLPAKGEIINQQVELIDIMPTICDIAGIRMPESDFIEGRSFYSLLKGEDIPFRDFTFSEHVEGLGEGRFDFAQFCIRSDRWKLIYTRWFNPYKEKYSLYNLQNDPGERNDLIGKNQAQFNLMNEKLKRWMSRPRPQVTTTVKPVSEEEQEYLRALGYLQ